MGQSSFGMAVRNDGQILTWGQYRQGGDSNIYFTQNNFYSHETGSHVFNSGQPGPQGAKGDKGDKGDNREPGTKWQLILKNLKVLKEIEELSAGKQGKLCPISVNSNGAI